MFECVDGILKTSWKWSHFRLLASNVFRYWKAGKNQEKRREEIGNWFISSKIDRPYLSHDIFQA